jgi:hypothetical protein
MSDGTAANAQGAAAAGTQGAAAQGANAQGQTGQGTGTPEYVTKADFDTLSTQLAEVLADNKRYRDDRRAAKGQGAANGTAATSGTANADSTVAAELATLQSELRTERFKNDITAAATKAGAVIPAQLYRLLDMEDVADDKGNVKNADKVIADLKKSTPALFGAVVLGGADGNNGNGSQSDPASMNDLIRKGARR